MHKYTAKGPVNNPLATEVVKVNKNTYIREIDPAEL